MTWVHTIVQGILLGGYFALFATGLSLMFGVMRLVNLAHGSLALVAAFCAVALVSATGMNAWLTLAIVVPAAAVVGYLLQRWLLNATVGGAEVTSVLVTFGLSIIITNVLLQVFSANSQGLQAGSIGDRVGPPVQQPLRRLVRRGHLPRRRRGAERAAAGDVPHDDRSADAGQLR